jgi:hypothetical protein
VGMGIIRRLSRKYRLTLEDWAEWHRSKRHYLAHAPLYFACPQCSKRVYVEDPFIGFLISLGKVDKVDLCQNCNRRESKVEDEK